MQVTVADIAAACGGTVIGNGSLEITGVAGLSEAGPQDLSFLANPRYEPQVLTTRAGAVLVGKEYPIKCVQILVKAPDQALGALMMRFGRFPTPPRPGVHPTAIVGDGVKLGQNISIGPYAVLGAGVSIGDNTVIQAHVVIDEGAAIGSDCLIYSNVSIREFCKIGSRVIIHCGTVIGSDGFGYVPVNGRHQKIPQIGIVIIEDDVEIGSNVSIDRARFGATLVGAGTKIDNLVQIAHNVRIGRDCLIISQVGIAGSTHLGDRVTLAGQVGLIGHIKVGNDVTVGAQSGVSKDLEAGQTYFGSPAHPIKTTMEQIVHVRRIPRIAAEVKKLQAEIETLKRRLDGPAA